MFKFRKKNLLKTRQKLTRGAILDEEITIEVFWRILNEIQEKIGELKKEIEINLKEIEVEKEKTPMDMEKIKRLNSENIALGWTDKKDKKGKPVYEEKVLSGMRQAMYYKSQIDQVVGKREYLKIQLKAIDRMIKTGYMKHFSEILESEAQISFQKK